MTDRVEFGGDLTEHERRTWFDWFARHGADPNDIPISGWVERHVDTYRLVYEVYDRNERGDRYANADRTDAVRRTVVFQLEAPPLPYPVGVRH